MALPCDADLAKAAYEQFLSESAASARKRDVSAALSHIHTNLLDPSLSVENTREKCGISTHSFAARFESEVSVAEHGHLTPKRYIAWARINIAERALAERAIPLTTLARLVGFRSYTSLYRWWISFKSKSPSG